MVQKIDLLKQTVCLVLPAALALSLAWMGMDQFAARNLYPRPDALEYALSASSLYHGEGFVLRLAGDAYYPPRYTPGYPFLLAGWYLIVGPHPERAYLFNLLITGMLVTTVCWITYRLSGSRNAVIFSGLLAATSGALLISSQGVRSDLSACWFYLIGLYLACYQESGREVEDNSSSQPKTKVIKVLLAGGFLGWAVLIRPSYLFPLAGCLPFLLIRRHESVLARGIRLFVCLIGLALVLIPLFVVNLMNLGDPLSSGYSLWAPDYCLNLRSAYSLENLWHSFDPGRWPKSNLVVYPDLIFGINQWTKSPFYGGVIWIPVIVLLVSFLKISRNLRVFLLASFISSLVLLGHYLLFFWQDGRFLLFMVPVIAILAGCGLSRIWTFRPTSFPYSGPILVILLLLGSIKPGVQSAWDSITRIKKGVPFFSEIDLLKKVDPLIERNAVVVSVLDETLCEEYLVRGTERGHFPLVLPNQGSHLLTAWQYNIPTARFIASKPAPPEPVFPLAGFGKDRLSDLRLALKQRRAVYLLQQGLDAFPNEVERLKTEFQLRSEGTELLKVLLRGANEVTP